MSIRRVSRRKMEASYAKLDAGYGVSVPSLFLQGPLFVDAGFDIDDDVTILVCDRMLMIIPSSRVSAEAEEEADEINREWTSTPHFGRVL